MTNSRIALSVLAASAIIFTGCGGGGSSKKGSGGGQGGGGQGGGGQGGGGQGGGLTVISGKITANKTLTAGKDWLLDGKVEVTAGATLTIEAGTRVAGKTGTNAWLLVHPNAKLNARGTAASPIIFTSQEEISGATGAPGQWGGITLVGNAGNAQTTGYEVDGTMPGMGSNGDNSGALTHLVINNTGIAVEQDKEINGLSFVGVGSGTTVQNISINRSGDDGIELWGGTVNLSNITIKGAQDDSFDTDQGWAGTVDGLNISDGVKAGIEMSGTSHATYKNVNIIVGAKNKKEGGLYFKAGDGEAIGGHFHNVTVVYNSATAEGHGAIHSKGTFDAANASFTNVKLSGSNATRFSGPSAAAIEAKFNAGSGNSK